MITTKKSPRSGRTKIAQRFIAGKLEFFHGPQVREADDRNLSVELSVARFAGWEFFSARTPALKCWAISKSPTSWTRTVFAAQPGPRGDAQCSLVIA
jgi:hypothetical protein